MFFRALGIGLLLLMIGVFSGAYSCLRRKGISRFTSLIMCGFALYSTMLMLLRIVNSAQEEKIGLWRKVSFVISTFSFAYDLTCDAIVTILEKLATTQTTVRIQYRSVANKQGYIVRSAMNEMGYTQLA